MPESLTDDRVQLKLDVTFGGRIRCLHYRGRRVLGAFYCSRCETYFLQKAETGGNGLFFEIGDGVGYQIKSQQSDEKKSCDLEQDRSFFRVVKKWNGFCWQGFSEIRFIWLYLVLFQTERLPGC